MTKRKYAHGNALVLEALGSDGSMYRGRFIIHRGQLTCEHFGASCQYAIQVLTPLGMADTFELTDEQMDALKRHVLKHAPEGPRLDERKWTSPVDQYVDASVAKMLFNMGLARGHFAKLPTEPPAGPPPLKYTLEELSPPPAVEAFQQLTARTPATTTHDAIYRARSLYFSGKAR